MADLTQALINAARTRSAQEGSRLIETLQEMAELSNAELVGQLAALFHCPAIDMAQLHELQPAFDVVAYQDAVKHGCVAVRDGTGTVLFVFADPFDAGLRAWAQDVVTQAVAWRLAHHADLSAYLALQEDQVRAVDDALLASDAASGGAELTDISLRSISEDTSPVVKLVNSALYDALKAEASDIHLESTPHGLVIKNRIDGVLNHLGEVRGREMAEQAISRIKVMAELNIAEHRIPQDGRFKAVLQGREVDFRVSVMPSIFGEDAVLC